MCQRRQLDQVRAAAGKAGVDPAVTDTLVDDYEESQLLALKTALLFAALLALISMPATRNLPDFPLGEPQADPEGPETVPT